MEYLEQENQRNLKIIELNDIFNFLNIKCLKFELKSENRKFF